VKLLKFNNEMLQAILDDEKTQTRRLIKPQPEITEQELRNLGAWANGLTSSERVNAAWQAGFIGVPCPYGEIGDIINFTDKDGNIKGELEITNVRVERVQEISESDALFEGFEHYHYSATRAFSLVWVDIYSEESWNANPWVWVIEFRRINNE
jgi:hypothetical protein